MESPARVTDDLQLIVTPGAPPLTGSQAIDLGKRLLERGCIAVALEAVGRGDRLLPAATGDRR